MKEIELVNKRKRNEKHFLQEDGSIVAKIYSDDIHFLKNGVYEEIDNSLVKKDDYYVNKNNDFKVFFKENPEKELMKLEKDGYFVEIKLLDSKNIKSKKHRKNKIDSLSDISYNDILNNIDIEYKMISNKLKETIVLKKQNHGKINFLIKTNLKLELKNNEIFALDENDNKIFNIEKPYMVDSNNIINNNIKYILDKKSSEYLLQMVLDEEWLKSENTMYPIYIDPTISSTQNVNSVYDTYIYPGDTNVDRNSQQYLKIGVEKVNNTDIVNRALLKFTLPDIGTSCEIINARLILQTCYGNGGSNIEKTLEIHKINTDWDETTANWNLMHDKYDDRVETLQFLSRRELIEDYEIDSNGNLVDISYEANTYSQFYDDITDLVKHWYKDTENYGIMIKANPEVYIDDNFPMIFSKNNTISSDLKPLLIISYRNQNGIEQYWNYKNQNFTDGNTYLNTYNGNLVGVFNIGKTLGNKFPLDLNLIYNTNDVIVKGNGFKLNYSQNIKTTSIENVEYLEYEDDDGTTHYFYQDGNTNVFYDEDGLEYKIEKETDYCNMFDKYGNKKIFTRNNDIYYLTRIENTNSDAINITLENNKITRLIDGNNTAVNITYLSNQMIIVCPDRTTTITYNGNNIVSIETINGITNFNYNNHNLISEIVDPSGLKTLYEYYSQKPYRIMKISQTGLDNNIGNFFNVEYGFNSTSLIDNKGRVNTLIFNSMGNLISSNMMPFDGDIANAYSTTNTYGENDSDKNKLYDKTIPVKYVNNRLFNTNSEKDSQQFAADYPQGVYIDYSDEYFNSGTRSVKIRYTSIGLGTYVYNGFWRVPKGKYYTFSGYFKNDRPIKIGLQDSSNNACIEVIPASDDFIRRDVTFYLADNTDGRIRVIIISDEEATIYVDDVQLEEGQVVNNYNCIENSDFTHGLLGWEVEASKEDYTNIDEFGFPTSLDVNPNEVFEVVDLTDTNKALQINMNPVGRSSFRKTFPIKGNRGDIYQISFWMKNEGLVGNEMYVGNTVVIYYKPIGQDAEYCVLGSKDFIPNNRWQYYSFKYSAEEDYESISLMFFQGRQANKMLITNLSFYKDLNTDYYEYDENGNISSIINSDGRTNAFKYNKDNQLISSTSPMGKNFKYEYDNNNKEIVHSSISSSGIANQVKYDENNNPIRTIISKKGKETISNGEYKIRSKGTNKYIKAEYNIILMEENSCSNTIWKLESSDNNYRIINSVNPRYSLTNNNGCIVLTENSNYNNLFSLEENDNGSYKIKISDDNKYLKIENNNLVVADYINDDNNFEFYFENIPNYFIENDAVYTEDGRFVESVTDSLFNKTTYEMDNVTGLITSITDANEQTTNYSYNDKHQLSSVNKGGRSISYSYNTNNLLSSIQQEGRTYNFEYDNFLNLKNIKIGDNVTILTNTYENNNGNLIKVRYANGSEVEYEYDEFDRLEKIHNFDKIYTLIYDGNGNVAKVVSDDVISTLDVDFPNEINLHDSTIKYNYDAGKRLTEYANDDFRISYKYDNHNNVLSKKYNLNNIEHSIDNEFNNDDSLTKTIIDNSEIQYFYDELNRLVSNNINGSNLNTLKYMSNGKRTSSIVEELIINNDRFIYEYDKLYNITAIKKNDEYVNKYYYDNFNQLINEEDLVKHQKTEYTYDNLGNITSKTLKNSVTNEIISSNLYNYNNLNWPDQLTEIDNVAITYDEIGNPIEIGNDISMSWVDGKKLYCYDDISKNLQVVYKYDLNGTRTSKIVNNLETKYYLENKNIIFEQRGNDIIYYLYDGSEIIGLEYNGLKYYYIKNLQGDIVGILDSSYNRIVTYEYDSWGKLLSVKDSNGIEITDNLNIGLINPFRYRSYYYDNETELYYLNNRYYNPKWCRFINADDTFGLNQDMIGYNLYTYCSNNPITYSDTSGNGLFKWIAKKAKKVVKSIVDTGKKFLSNLISVEVNHSYTSSTKNGNILMNAEYGNTTTVTTGRIGSSNSFLKIKLNIDDGNIFKSTVGVGTNGKYTTSDLSIGLLSGGAEIGFKSSDSHTTSFRFGIDGLDLYTGIANTDQINDNVSVTQYTNLNVNMIVPVVVYVSLPYVVPALSSLGVSGLATYASGFSLAFAY